MQKKIKYISILKPRLYNYLDMISTTKYRLSKDTGVPQSVLTEKYKSGLSEESILKIIKALPGLDLEWWFRGRGEPIKSAGGYQQVNRVNVAAEPNVIYQQQELIIKTQQDLIESLYFQIETLKGNKSEDK